MNEEYEESYDSFLIVENEEENKKKDKNKVSNNNIINSHEKRISKANNRNKHKTIIDNNPFLKKNDFFICSEGTSENDNEDEKEENNKNDKRSKSKSKNDISFQNFFNEKDKIYKNVFKKSESFEHDSMSSSIIFNKIEKSKFYMGGFISLNYDNDKEKPDAFTTDCKFYDKKNYLDVNGKLNVDERFNVSFKVEKNLSDKLYYNEKYYKFSLLSIKNISNNLAEKCIEINLKDNRYFFFKLTKHYKEFNDALEFALPNTSDFYFKNAFARKKLLKTKLRFNGWELYDFDKEFKRQEVDFKNTFDIIDNSDFKFCPSYPKKIIEPQISIVDLEKCALFRTKKRIPTLTYRHNNGFCIWRSSQTKSGFMGKSEKDVKLLTKIAETSKKLLIYDARPKINAMANRLKGAGYENPSNYPKIDVKIIFCNIPNIHTVRTSFEKICSNISFNNDSSDYNYKGISNLPNTFWYETIILIISSSFDIYHKVLEKNTILIHCSDGWDRTAQLSSLSQLLLDKYYRTLEGFIILIEKDWLSFGHQFQYRNGFYSPNDPKVGSENQFSPIFIQWLDCVYQIMCQNYDKFEFNLNLLTYIADEVFTGKFGTFLFNNEKDRENNEAKVSTISIWSIVMENKEKYLNPIYEPYNKKEITFNYKNIRLWREYFYRFEKGENNDSYLNFLNSNINKKEKIIEEKQKLIEEMAKIILKHSNTFSSISKEVEEEINKYKEKFDMFSSFEILNPTQSFININKK